MSGRQASVVLETLHSTFCLLRTHTLVTQSSAFQLLQVTRSCFPVLGPHGILSANPADYQSEILLFTHSEIGLNKDEEVEG